MHYLQKDTQYSLTKFYKEQLKKQVKTTSIKIVGQMQLLFSRTSRAFCCADTAFCCADTTL